MFIFDKGETNVASSQTTKWTCVSGQQKPCVLTGTPKAGTNSNGFFGTSSLVVHHPRPAKGFLALAIQPFNSAFLLQRSFFCQEENLRMMSKRGGSFCEFSLLPIRADATIFRVQMFSSCRFGYRSSPKLRFSYCVPRRGWPDLFLSTLT